MLKKDVFACRGVGTSAGLALHAQVAKAAEYRVGETRPQGRSTQREAVRAEAFAYERMTFRKVHGKKVAVIGAIIDLGLCLNMFEQDALRELHAAHEDLVADFAVLGEAMPENKGKSEDLVLRYLDQAVFTHLHSMRKRLASVSPYQPCDQDSTRGSDCFPTPLSVKRITFKLRFVI